MTIYCDPYWYWWPCDRRREEGKRHTHAAPAPRASHARVSAAGISRVRATSPLDGDNARAFVQHCWRGHGMACGVLAAWPCANNAAFERYACMRRTRRVHNISGFSLRVTSYFPLPPL